MIYFCDKDKNIETIYEKGSGVKYVVMYVCDREFISYGIYKKMDKNIYVPFESLEAIKKWEDEHCYEVETDVEKCAYSHCVQMEEKDCLFLIKKVIEIDWNKDYVFYENGYEMH